MAERLLARINNWIESWMEELDNGDGVFWETTVFPTPTDGTMLYLSLAIPGALPETIINRGCNIRSPWGLTSDQLRATVEESLDTMRSDRVKQAAAAMGTDDGH